jgi:hypothetical protein
MFVRFTHYTGHGRKREYVAVVLWLVPEAVPHTLGHFLQVLPRDIVINQQGEGLPLRCGQ